MFKSLLLVLTGVALTGVGLGLAAAAFLPVLLDIDIGETAAQMERTCRPSHAGDAEARTIVDSPRAAAGFQERWDLMVQVVDQGAPASMLTFDESEVTSRANQLLLDAPLKNLTICFHEGEAEAWGNVRFQKLAELPLIGWLFDANVRVRGTVDLEGEYPRLVISELKAGHLPRMATNELKYELENIVDERLRRFKIERGYSVIFHEGLAEVRVQHGQ